MCLAIPALIVELQPGNWAITEVGGVRSRVCLALIDAASVGDYVIVHAGFALTHLDTADAERSLALFAEIAANLDGRLPAGPRALRS